MNTIHRSRTSSLRTIGRISRLAQTLVPRPAHVGWRVAMIVGIAAIALGNGRVGAADIRQSVAMPSVTDVSATTQYPAIVHGYWDGFTPGGRVYLAIYDQMELSSTRRAGLPPVSPGQ